MLLEDDRFKIVGARTGTPLPPHLRLETSNLILLRPGCQTRCQTGPEEAIGFGGGDVDAGMDQDAKSGRGIGQRKELGTAADGGGAAAEQEEGHVAAEMLGQFDKLRE